MTDEEMLKALRESPLGDRWHIWIDSQGRWCALPPVPPFGDPIRADTAGELTAKLNAPPRPTDQGSL